MEVQLVAEMARSLALRSILVGRLELGEGLSLALVEPGGLVVGLSLAVLAWEEGVAVL